MFLTVKNVNIELKKCHYTSMLLLFLLTIIVCHLNKLCETFYPYLSDHKEHVNLFPNRLCKHLKYSIDFRATPWTSCENTSPRLHFTYSNYSLHGAGQHFIVDQNLFSKRSLYPAIDCLRLLMWRRDFIKKLAYPDFVSPYFSFVNIS